MKKWSIGIMVIMLIFALCIYKIHSSHPVSAKSQVDIWDEWEQSHGINVLKTSKNGYNVIWASAQKTSENGDWTHDVYGMIYRNGHTIKKTLVSAHEAQEPSSASQCADGHILVTFEDGNAVGDYGVMQRYAIFDKNLNNVVSYDPYKTIIKNGGHSGHVTSVSNTFVVVCDEGWINKDGILNRGTGKEIYITTMNSVGNNKKTFKIANTSSRYDWPLVAGSKNKAFILWQRIVPNKKYTKLMMATFNLKTRKVSNPKAVSKIKCQYYNYSVSYMPKVNCFILTATDHHGVGHMYLYNTNGKQLCHKSGLGRFSMESSPAVSNNSIVYPTHKKSLTLFKVTHKSIKKIKIKKTSLSWSSRGQAGVFDTNGKVVFYVLQKNKLKHIKMKI
jgi:hypothetical protein